MIVALLLFCVVSIVAAAAGGDVLSGKAKEDRLNMLRDWVPKWEKKIAELREHKSKSQPTSQESTLLDDLTTAKLRKLTVQLEKARLELQGFDASAADTRHVLPAEDKERLRSDAIKKELTKLADQRRAAQTTEMRDMIDARIAALNAPHTEKA